MATFTELIWVGTRLKRGGQDTGSAHTGRGWVVGTPTLGSTPTACQVPTRLGGREAVGKQVELFASHVSPSSARAVSADRRHMQSLEGGTPTLGSP